MQKQLVFVVSLLGVAFFLCFAIYARALNGPLLFDDFPQLLPLISSEDKSLGFLTQNFLLSSSGPLNRPISMFSFILSANLSGTNIWQWKLVNLVIHILCGFVIFLLLSILFKTNKNIPETNSKFIAVAISCVWLLHPLQISTVLYTVQRMTELSTLFVLLGMLIYALGRGRQLGQEKYGTVLLTSAFLVFCPLAIFSKENGALLPLFLLLVEHFFFNYKGNKHVRAILMGFFSVFLFLPILALIIFLIAQPEWLLNGYDTRTFTLTERLLTEGRIVVRYIFMVLAPFPGSLVFFYDNITVSSGWISPITTIVSFFILLSLLIASWYLRYKTLFSFGILFFFAGHLLESSFIALELMFEHRNYLPSLGLLIALAQPFYTANKKTLLVKTSAISIFIVFALLTLQRANHWSSEEKFYSFLQDRNADSDSVAAYYAQKYTDKGLYADARNVLANPDSTGQALQRAYITCLEVGILNDKNLLHIKNMVRGAINHYQVTGLLEIANIGLAGRCRFSRQIFLEVLDQAVAGKINGLNKQKLLLYKAHYIHSNNDDRAFKILEDAFSVYPENPTPLFLATEWLLDKNKLSEASMVFSKARNAAKSSPANYQTLITRITNRFILLGVDHNARSQP